MRYKIKSSRQLESWHRWFAWFPVPVDNYYVWLEYVYRKAQWDPYGWSYDYRIESPESDRP